MDEELELELKAQKERGPVAAAKEKKSGPKLMDAMPAAVDEDEDDMGDLLPALDDEEMDDDAMDVHAMVDAVGEADAEVSDDEAERRRKKIERKKQAKEREKTSARVGDLKVYGAGDRTPQASRSRKREEMRIEQLGEEVPVEALGGEFSDDELQHTSFEAAQARLRELREQLEQDEEMDEAEKEAARRELERQIQEEYASEAAAADGAHGESEDQHYFRSMVGNMGDEIPPDMALFHAADEAAEEELVQIFARAHSRFPDAQRTASELGLEPGTTKYTEHMVREMYTEAEVAKVLEAYSQPGADGEYAGNDIVDLVGEEMERIATPPRDQMRSIEDWHELQEAMDEDGADAVDGGLFQAEKVKPHIPVPLSLSEDHTDRADWDAPVDAEEGGRGGGDGSAPQGSKAEGEGEGDGAGDDAHKAALPFKDDVWQEFERIGQALAVSWGRSARERNLSWEQERQKKKKKHERFEAIGEKFRKVRAQARKGSKRPRGPEWERRIRKLPRGTLPTADKLLWSVGVEDPDTHPCGKLMQIAAVGLGYNASWSVKDVQRFLAKTLHELETYQKTEQEDLFWSLEEHEAFVRGEDLDKTADSDYDEYDQYDNIEREEARVQEAAARS